MFVPLLAVELELAALSVGSISILSLPAVMVIGGSLALPSPGTPQRAFPTAQRPPTLLARTYLPAPRPGLVPGMRWTSKAPMSMVPPTMRSKPTPR